MTRSEAVLSTSTALSVDSAEGTVPLHRLLDRRETTALLMEFGTLMPEVDLALIRADGRLFVGTGEWTQAELQEAGCRIQETDGYLPTANGCLYPLLAGPRLAGALVARGPGLAEPRRERALRCLHRSLTLFLAQALEKRAIARETLERYREINLLYNIGETIGACLDPEEIPRLVLEEANRIIRAGAGVVLLRRPEPAEGPAVEGEGDLDVKATFGDVGHAEALYRVSRHVVEQVCSTGQPAIVTDLPPQPPPPAPPPTLRLRSGQALGEGGPSPPELGGTEEGLIQWWTGEGSGWWWG